MTSSELCDALVDHFNALASKPITYQAKHTDEIDEALKERSDYVVFVVADTESDEPFDHADTCREEYVPSVVVNGPINTLLTKAKGDELQRFLRDSLRNTEFAAADGNGELSWDGTEVVSLFDHQVLKTKKQFLCWFRPTYYRFA